MFCSQVLLYFIFFNYLLTFTLTTGVLHTRRLRSNKTLSLHCWKKSYTYLAKLPDFSAMLFTLQIPKSSPCASLLLHARFQPSLVSASQFVKITQILWGFKWTGLFCPNIHHHIFSSIVSIKLNWLMVKMRYFGKSEMQELFSEIALCCMPASLLFANAFDVESTSELPTPQVNLILGRCWTDQSMMNQPKLHG